MIGDQPLLEVRDLRKSFAVRSGLLESADNGAFGRAMVVDGVTFSMAKGETLGLVGESGCGKTTLARMIVRLIEPDSGEMRFRGHDWLGARGPELRTLRSRIQMVFQDPLASLNARMRVGAIVGEPLAIHESRLDLCNAKPAPARCSRPSGSERIRLRAILMNFPVVSGNALVSPARSSCGPIWSLRTSLFPRSMFPWELRSSSCSSACGANSRLL